VKLLESYPPQTSARQVAAVWGCHIHNKVNERLGHDIYDCSHIIEDYDCGCGGDEELEGGVPGSADEKPLVDQQHYQFEVEREEKQHG
jgi:FAD-linked sulfhydryl oxidase